MNLHSKDLSDVQSHEAKIRIGIRRVGVCNIPKIIRRKRFGIYNELSARIDVYVDLLPTKRGIHMSRNIEAINEVISTLTEDVITDCEELCVKIAEKALNIQPYAKYAEVNLVADYEMETYSEAILRKKSSIHKLRAGACVEKIGEEIKITKTIGAEVEGTTVCPCSQELSKDITKERLIKQDFSDEQIEKILKSIPLAAHNQRSKSILLIEQDRDAERIELEDVIQILESSMSSPVHEVLKRKDEQAVVLYAHQNPVFVEDVVRSILHKVYEHYKDRSPDTVISVKQINYESIHQHNAVAEVKTTLQRIKKQLNGFEDNENY
ncbi:MAG: GTP cyclohydrolase I FolE2 [Candidatus Heimdallarchaeota archaeon]|nr:GTP cyclohydrolase I FolE2 [Candidatus Heimdallarchaeota archaeon]MCK4954922.1 GTP cyclohydrolase I FolE2 [Candidatus Heimdallarchaeota archaeon]